MKLFYKMFLGIFGTTLLIFSVFGTYLVGKSYQSALEREQESAFQESQMYQYAFLTAYGSLSENSRNEENAVNVAKSVWESMGDGRSVFSLENGYGKNLYQSGGIPAGDSERGLEAGQSTSQILERDGEYYLRISSCLAIDNTTYYMNFWVDITHIYLEREALIGQYRVAILAVFVVAGVWSFLFSKSLTRPLHKLSVTSRKFANGDYKIRAEQGRNDEVGDLIKDFNQMADALEDNMEALTLAAKQQEDFSAAFAHELKTPLTSIIGYSDMLRSMDLSLEERQSSANYIYQQGKRLERLGYKLLEMMGIEKYKSSFTWIETRRLEEGVQKLVEPLMQEKAILCMLQLDEAKVFGDYDLLISLLTNVVDNARKACGQGGKIAVVGQIVEQNYRIEITDNGRGIPQNELGRITEAFYMVDKSRSRKEGGAGIGLALCGKIIKVHGGTWKIESEQQVGTKVSIELPMDIEKVRALNDETKI